jgi:hypothetical protein
MPEVNKVATTQQKRMRNVNTGLAPARMGTRKSSRKPAFFRINTLKFEMIAESDNANAVPLPNEQILTRQNPRVTRGRHGNPTLDITSFPEHDAIA